MPDRSNIIRVDPIHPDTDTIQKAGKLLAQNGVVIFPAQCLYGIAANATDAKAVEKVFQIKQRPESNPVLILIRDPDDLPVLVTHTPDTAQKLMDRFWPGNLTLVFQAADHLSPRLTAGTGRIGIRLPGHPVAQALVNAVDFPITGTSANISGHPGCTRPEALPPAISQKADLILDAGPVKGGVGSSIVDVTTTPPTVLREGALTAQALSECLN